MALKKSKSIIALAISCLLLLAACDDDGSSSPVSPSDSEESSSSVATANSSSSAVKGSSSSTDSAKSSSSVKKESSSSVTLSSSSSDKSVVDESSSSVATANSSSSAVKGSSSSTDSAKSSSSVTLSSSSSDINIVDESSSSDATANSSSSAVDIRDCATCCASGVILCGEESSSSTDSSNSSSSDSGESNSSTGEAGWSWDVPKESRFNPDITYGTMTDSRDKKVYKTVKIGGQTWMAENLNYADSATTPSLLNRSWCYNNDSANCAVAGRLYTWAAAIDSAKLYKDKSIDCGYHKTCALPDTVYGICPPGWHLPTRAEWDTLFTEVDGKSTAGKILKSQTGWYKNGNGTDDVGFSALPAGERFYYGHFDYDGYHAYFWSATEEDDNHAFDMHLFYSYADAGLYSHYKHYGYSVRCLQN